MNKMNSLRDAASPVLRIQIRTAPKLLSQIHIQIRNELTNRNRIPLNLEWIRIRAVTTYKTKFSE